eukprot:TRINITY_DN585_c0_g1_i3.p1 TRINITY_DN585_c0_g1~~TRINITY_DN585_c0_g1_i3.p1  ORF type:complete len:555 (-),score=72.29 TRINITY_DN585_c0_g1_i3:141-1805(-)
MNCTISLLDYGAGNVRSVVNAFSSFGVQLRIIKSPDELLNAEKLVFPGVGAFGSCLTQLDKLGYREPLKQYIQSGKPFFGICVGLQCLFEFSDESPGVPGLGIFSGTVKKFPINRGDAVPHMGWNTLTLRKESPMFTQNIMTDPIYVYFVHSFFVGLPSESNYPDWVLSTTNYAQQEYVSAIHYNNIFATQFHPEKSGEVGLRLLQNFVELDPKAFCNVGKIVNSIPSDKKSRLAKRIIACLDVRSNDDGDLVVTKGDQYDVREKKVEGEKGSVRNMGKPVQLAQFYFEQGADEITFLNITSFRNCPLKDVPVLELLKKTSETVYVPLTIGGGISNTTDSEGNTYTALEVASEYFRSGADKVSIGSDAVYAVEEYISSNGVKTGTSSIEQISKVYGAQAVVISVDPQRVYVQSPEETTHHTIKHREKGPNGEEYCWYQCTTKGGREKRDLDVKQLCTVCEELGAGEILLNCINKDGTNSGYDIDLIKDVKGYVTIPVIASSGAGSINHFCDLFNESVETNAALAAGIFHRREVSIQDVKQELKKIENIHIRCSN